MSVEDDLLKIKEIKKSLNSAIRAKGSDIADDTKFDQYPGKINEIVTDPKEIATYEITEEGVLISPELDLSGKFNDVKKIELRSLMYSFYEKEIKDTDLTFPELVEINSYGMDHAFAREGTFTQKKGLKNIFFPKLVSIGFRGMSYAFENNNSIETLDFPRLENIGEQGMYSLINSSSSKLKSINFPKLTVIGKEGMYNSFSQVRTNLTSVNFPELTKISQEGFYITFTNCYALKECLLPKLTEIQDFGMGGSFRGCTALTKISFPSLTSVGEKIFGDAAYNYTFSFSSLTEIHFPAAIKSTIEALTGYSDKWGATNATIYFDL